jgi:hypothetical protein
MKLALSGALALVSVMAVAAQAQTPIPAQAAAAPASGTPTLSMDCHLLYRGVPMKEATSYQVIGNELYGISGPIKTKLSQAGTPVTLGTSKDADGTVMESFASHTVNDTTLERTVFWKKGAAAMKSAFKEIYDFKAKTVMNSSDTSDFCHANGK